MQHLLYIICVLGARQILQTGANFYPKFHFIIDRLLFCIIITVPILAPKSRILWRLGRKWSQAFVTVLYVPGPPNFAGTLVRSIPTQINRFWDISGTLKKLFIFVHFVHSGNLGPHFSLPNVRSSSHCTYQP